MNTISLLALFFCGTFGAVAAALWLMRLTRQWEPPSLEPHGDASAGAALLKEERVSTIGFWEKTLKRLRAAETLRKRLEEADLPWSAGRLTAMMLLCGACAAVLVRQMALLPGLLQLALTLLAAIAPYLWVQRRREGRFRKLAAQFPDALDSMARALKAGHPFSACMMMLATEQPEPVAGEMRRCFEQWKLGGSWEQTLDDLVRRVPIPEVTIFASAVKMQSKAGGKLNEVLNNIAEGMRDRVVVEDEIRAVSAHGRMTGAVLTALPVLIFLMMTVVSPGYIQLLLAHPYGKNMIGAAAVCVAVAHFVIRRMVQVRL